MTWLIPDWEPFNARGVELAMKLKKELGNSAHVQFVRAHDDPGEDEVLYDSREADS